MVSTYCEFPYYTHPYSSSYNRPSASKVILKVMGKPNLYKFAITRDLHAYLFGRLVDGAHYLTETGGSWP